MSGAYGAGKPRRMPFGLVNFKIAVAKPGDTVAVKLYFSEPAPFLSKWYKYDGVAGAWYDFSNYAKFSYDRRSLTLTLRDGGPGDADGIANGVIVNPAGIGVGGDEESGQGAAALINGNHPTGSTGLTGFFPLSGHGRAAGCVGAASQPRR